MFVGLVLRAAFTHCELETFVFFLMIRRPPRSTLDRSSAASDVYKRQVQGTNDRLVHPVDDDRRRVVKVEHLVAAATELDLSLIHISEPTRPY